MYNVMIVEDEMLVRLGFKHYVQWDKYGMTVCADVANGREAWDYYTGSGEAKPDLIITDLKMPIMDGIELIKKIRERDRETRIVILSCLEDFDLIRQAMQLGVSNYILKLAMTEGEIENVLTRVREELGTQRSIGTTKGMIHNPDVLKENIIKNYVFYNLYSKDEFQHHIMNLKLRLYPERLVVCMMEIDHFDQVQTKFKDEKGELIRMTFLNVLNELLDQSRRGEVVSDEDKRYLFLFSFRDIASEYQIHEELNGIISHIQKVLQRFFNISVTFGISGMKNGFGSLHALYRESEAAVGQKYFFGTESILSHWEIEKADIAGIVKNKLRQLPDKWPKSEEAGYKEVESIVTTFLDTGRINREQDVRKFFIRMLHGPAVTAYLNESESTLLGMSYVEEMQKCDTLDESIEVFGHFVSEIMSMRSSKKQLSKDIARAVQYIQERYQEDVSLPRIADYLELSPNHLSGLFKKELQVNFTEYLNRIRLDKAKDLLLNTNLKSYEIAERVGFADDSYFSRAFKNHVGVRPNGFRRLWVNDKLGGADDK